MLRNAYAQWRASDWRVIAMLTVLTTIALM
jgi:hypothetical protein